ncbi:hypothetical protein CK503_00185 [Aliifodinibius salipaludis]|uniref:DUF2520 domain-containing protein n=1 Tax=Fodinibius salipaludis TaxID=2032627 RepID=A0A2A2GDS2_9BACT|nr:Rossmann-like and DUF2520 domain-containing protein [Aliifodinibius salipaludis]PAU95518.1 hypothetical protein CK503_00185 [Aliifodinibius salipaludis]
MEAPDITIIGVGRLGNSLAKALSAAGIPIKSLYNRTANKAQKLAADLNINVSGSFPSDDHELGDLIFITVADGAIEGVAHRLADITEDFSAKTIVHCSGNESAIILADLKSKGGSIASFHPLQTFTGYSEPSDFEEIYFSLQGNKSAFPQLKEVAKRLGAETLEVTEDQKSHLHVAAVLASNYLNTLLDAAVETASASGLAPKKAKKALMPLVKTTLQNIEDQSFEDALSGPIKRGDLQTVEHHLDLLKDKPELLALYQILGQRTVELAKKSQQIDHDTARKMIKMLK